MREILFRGKQKCIGGEWVEGCLLFDEEQNEAYIAEHFEDRSAYIREVIPETIGQYTGMTDMNGKKIFEGDIVKHYCNSEDKTIFDVGQFYWCENICQFRRTSRTEGQFYDVNSSCEYEVIGNIHDNPELLKGGEG